jgi:dipeptidyl aminopeptidase/acylaminoacyl peptidase
MGLCLLTVALSAVGADGQAASDDVRTVDVQYQSGEVTLAALLLIPGSGQPVPGAVIIQGSGTSDRSNQWSRDIANSLVRHGIAVLLTDKRGSGTSGGDWQEVGFKELAGDALAGVQFLKNRPEIDRQRVGLVGLSQGGWVAPLTAARSHEVAFVVNVSGASVGFAEQTFLEMGNTARQAGLSDPLVQVVIRLNSSAVRFLTTGDWDQYEHARTSALATGAREVAAGFPESRDAKIWTFLRSVVEFDPLPYWGQVAQPVLVVYGAEDEQDNVPVAESVRRLEHVFAATRKDNYQILVASGVGHGIRDPRTHQLAAEFIDTLAAWLTKYVTSR